jgi:hypothetical protein
MTLNEEARGLVRAYDAAAGTDDPMSPALRCVDFLEALPPVIELAELAAMINSGRERQHARCPRADYDDGHKAGSLQALYGLAKLLAEHLPEGQRKAFLADCGVAS